MSDNEHPKDYLGKDIRVGDDVVWAAQRVDSPCLCKGVVTKVTKVMGLSFRGDVMWKIQAKRSANDTFEVDGRLVTLSFPNRMVVISKNTSVFYLKPMAGNPA